MILVFKLAPEYGTEMLSSAPKPKKAGTCLTEHTPVLDKPHSGRSSII